MLQMQKHGVKVSVGKSVGISAMLTERSVNGRLRQELYQVGSCKRDRILPVHLPRRCDCEYVICPWYANQSPLRQSERNLRWGKVLC